MKRKIIIVSFILIAAFLVYRFAGREAHLPDSGSKVDKPLSHKHSEKKNRISTQGNGAVEEVAAEDEKVKDLIKEICNKDISVFDRTPKILMLRQMNLSKNDERMMLEHLSKVDLEESQSIKNDLIEHMVRYGSDKSRVGEVLLAIITNPHQDRVVREYVLQYVPEFYTGRWKQGQNWDNAEEQDRQLFNQALWEITDLTEGSMAGGALFALHRIAEKYEDIDQMEVFKKAREVLIDPSYMNPNRMGAVQILAFSNNEEYFEAARNIVMDKNQPVLLQVTAIHTAAQSRFPDKDFISYLKQVSKGGEEIHPSLQKCASLTLLKLK